MIDTHAHIDDPQYQDHLDDFIRLQQQAGVEAIIVPGVDETNIDAVWQTCQQYPNYLYPAIGLHPENIREDWQTQLATIHSKLSAAFNFQLSTFNYYAIGEIGLDYHFDTTYKAEQQAALRKQLHWAVQYDLPAILHVRDATEDALAVLKEFTPSLRGVMHCWSGSEEVAREIVNMGLYLGIGGIITFKNCKLREHLGSIPLERLVLETDAPYMAPVPHRGERNESRWIAYVIDELSRIYGVAPAEIDRVTTQNAKTLFRF
ncbi:MAG: TatD family hydrolase [Paludibacteraceae bacterium]|nr:TatD family hydrolase [Paludibacteraceae bacterium]